MASSAVFLYLCNLLHIHCMPVRPDSPPSHFLYSQAPCVLQHSLCSCHSSNEGGFLFFWVMYWGFYYSAHSSFFVDCVSSSENSAPCMRSQTDLSIEIYNLLLITSIHKINFKKIDKILNLKMLNYLFCDKMIYHKFICFTFIRYQNLPRWQDR